MINVLKNEFKRNLLPFIIVNTICLLILGIFMWLSGRLSAYNTLDFVSAILTITTIFYLFYNFSYNKYKSQIDFYYSAINKKDLLLGKYIFSIIEIAITNIIFILFPFILLLLMSKGIYGIDHEPYEVSDFDNFFSSSLIQMLFSFALFNMFLFFYHRANTIVDGIVYIFFGLMIPYIIQGIFVKLFYLFGGATNPRDMIFLISNSKKIVIDGYIFDIIMYIIYVLAGIALVIYMILKSKDNYGENVGHVDNKIVGYRLFVPFLYIGSSITLGINLFGNFYIAGIISVIIIYAIGQYIFYIIKNRSFILPKKDIQSLIITTSIILVISILNTAF